MAAASTRLAVETGTTIAGIAVEALGGTPKRRCSSRGARHWIEVRGLDTENGRAIADEVLTALRDTPGVCDASLNSAVARVVVTVEDDGPSRAELCKIVDDAERRAAESIPRKWPTTLPGDDEVVVARTAAAAMAAAGFGLAVAGSALRVGLPEWVSVPPTVLDHIPSLRTRIEQRLGPEGADFLFALANSTAAALTTSPTSAAAEAATRAMLAAEAWNARRAWHRYESDLAQHPSDASPRITQTSAWSAERYANRSGAAGVAAAAALGLLSANPRTAGLAALVAAPKPIRTTREAFGCALTRGLSDQHGALVLHPRVLRRLDCIDTVVIDPRVLYTDDLAVSRVTGLQNSDRTKAWNAARTALENGKLGPGWHPLSSILGAGSRGQALISPIRDPLAGAVVAEARQSGRAVVSIADDGLRSLAKGFDHLHPLCGSIDDSIADAIATLRADGATIALLTTPDMQAAHDANFTVGVARGEQSPPWGADVFVPDLSGAWRLLRALQAARDVKNRGIELSASSSLIGALMLIPGVPGSGPVSVNTAAIAGIWSGFATGAKLFRAEEPTPEPVQDWHALPIDEVQRLLPRPAEEPEAARPGRIAELSAAPPIRLAGSLAGGTWRASKDFVAELRANLADPITPILATGALASALLGSPFDAALVGGVLLANAALSAEQQLHAERVLRRLLAVQEPNARRRVGDLDTGEHEEIEANRLRLGDIIEVRAGEVIPADGRLIAAVNVEVDESALTGESLPVVKHTEPTPGAPLAERACMVYAGSTIVAGSGFAVVTAVGRMSEMRRAMSMAPGKSREIGLQSQLRRITGRALPFSIGGGALVGLLSTIRRTPLRESVGSAVSIVVAAVPEGLPLVATLAQLSAARKLSNRSVLIRNPHSVEAFARLDVVCFDKTGTLSENRLTVRSVQPLPGHSAADVLHKAARTTYTSDGHRAGHATDDAIFRAAEAESVAPAPEFDEVLPFQSGRPFAATLQGAHLSIKGAPEVVTAALAEDRPELGPMLDKMTASGLRVLAVAERRLDEDEAAAAAADSAVFERLCRNRLTPVGLIGLADTPRESAQTLLKELGNRGIGVRLLTGDHPVTAAVIAAELGLDVTADEVMTGSEWELLSAEERAEAVTHRVVFARMSPEHKVDVVQTLERADVVTAMVGDGANDAAAIRAATVGIGVAAAGSDPARTAADVMLLDGRIEAMLDALDEGHQLWRRVQSAVSVLLGGNAGEVCFAIVTSLLTGRSVLNARQMLLVNMLTDALPAAALAVSPQVSTAQADRDEAAMWRAIGLRGAATTAGASLAWVLSGAVPGGPRRTATVSLIGLVGTQMLQTLTDSHGPLVVATTAGSFAVMFVVVSTPGLSQLFGCTPVGPIGWGQGLFAATAASTLAATAPGVLERLVNGARSVVDNLDNADTHQDGVEVAERRGEHSNGAAEQRVLPETAEEATHDSAN
ncbi:MAG TPA: cation-translocating P-type ATPase [Mycobacterium sp.]|nr:cation-translocating P-type ATPase [Mycobacterium sp.]